MKFFIFGWLVLLAVGIAIHFLVFEQLEKDYINVKNVYQAKENRQVVEFLQKSHYIVSPKIEHYIGNSSINPITPQQVCDSINLTTTRLSQVPTFTSVGKIFETKLKNNNAEAEAVCNNPLNLTNSTPFST